MMKYETPDVEMIDFNCDEVFTITYASTGGTGEGDGEDFLNSGNSLPIT